ncbi:VOC family protein [Luteimicrobium sp. NPDC057192]|uniref:VOC family protein n=1 Tax=Luteimicrobium sp. NPDC057192 TaxID=3346042 RepID=UPI0036353F10
MTAPNLFITYVADAPKAAAFYADLFELEPTLTTPGYIVFRVAPGVDFAVWSGVSDASVPQTPRTSEVCVAVPAGEDVDAIFARWIAKGVTVVAEPHDEPFGRTFVISDPDGNLIRVAPVD